MKKTAKIQARVEPELINQVKPILNNLGLSMTQAITLFLNQVKLKNGLPFRVEIPNKETEKAIRDVDAGIGVSVYHSKKELFKELDL